MISCEVFEPLEGTPRGSAVLIHAFPVNRDMWVDVAVELATGGWRVLLPDLPGFGDSDVSAEEPDLGVMAEAVLAAMDEQDIDACVVGGLSMGGYVVMELLRRAPHRLTGIILADTKAAADPEAARANRLQVAEAVVARGSADALAEAMLPNLLGATTRAGKPEVVDAVRSMILSTGVEGIAWAQRAMAKRPDSFADISAFSGPCLIVWGDEDTISPRADQDAMVEALAGKPNATLAVIPGAGHLAAIEESGQVALVVGEFLAGVAQVAP